MARPTTKAELISAANENYEKLQQFIASMTETELETPFDFTWDEKKKEAHWKRDRNLRDVLTHLYEWHRLLLHWVKDKKSGGVKSFLPSPYNWRTYGDMNLGFWKKHQDTTLEQARRLLESSHQEVMECLDSFTDEELFSRGAYAWVGGSTLGSYFISNTSAHYDWALRKLKAHRKRCKAVSV